LVTLPSQCFSHSQGFLPPILCRSYFIPVSPLGFFPSRPISTHRLIHSFEFLYLLVVSSSYCLCSIHFVFHEFPRILTRFHTKSFFEQRFVRFAPLQGFVPYECPCLPVMNNIFQKTATFLGFFLLREFSLSTARYFLVTYPLMSLTYIYLSIWFVALQSLSSRKIGLTLSSLPPLSRFFTLSSFLNLYSFSVSGLPLKDRPALPLFCVLSLKRYPYCLSSSGASFR
jgi:hypothetical protein